MQSAPAQFQREMTSIFRQNFRCAGCFMIIFSGPDVIGFRPRQNPPVYHVPLGELDSCSFEQGEVTCHRCKIQLVRHSLF